MVSIFRKEVIKLKRNYVEPEIDIVLMKVDDVITTSPPEPEGGDWGGFA